MMYVQVPIFPGFSNIGICPGPFPGISVCILDKIEKTDHLSSEFQQISYKYLPYYQNHVYFLFPDDGKMGDVIYFESDRDLQRHLHYHLGSRQVHGRYLNVSVSREWVPHLTSPLADLQFGVEEDSHRNIKNIQKNCYSNKNLKTTKKIQNSKISKKKQKSTKSPQNKKYS